MSKKISITWNKAPPKEVAGKLEFYEIDLKQNYGLLNEAYLSRLPVFFCCNLKTKDYIRYYIYDENNRQKRRA